MKVRIGFGLGIRTPLTPSRYERIVDHLEDLGFDSLWLSERINGPALDPLVAMAYGAARTTRLKFGTSVMILPGRNPVVAAKELATLAALSRGRLLPAFGLGAVDPIEQQAFGVERAERAAIFDETLSVMRACWSGRPVTHHGTRFSYDGLVVEPVAERLEVWLGGIAPSELRRVGRLGDGWLPAFITPAEAEAGRETIEQVAAEHDRQVEEDHFGVLIPYALGGAPERFVAQLRTRRPDLEDSTSIVPETWEQLRDLIGQFVSVGTTKFVVVPMHEPTSDDEWSMHLHEAADNLLDLEN